MSTRQPDLVIANKKKENLLNNRFYHPSRSQNEIEKIKKRDKCLNLAWELKQTMGHVQDSNTSYNWCTWNNHLRTGEGTGRHGNKRTSGDYRDYRIVKNGQNIEKSTGAIYKHYWVSGYYSSLVPTCVMVKRLGCRIVVSSSNSSCAITFIPWERYEPPYPSSKDGFGIKWIRE